MAPLSPPSPLTPGPAPALKKKRSAPGALTAMFSRDRTVNVGFDRSMRAASFKKHLCAFVALHGRNHRPRKARTGFFSLSDILRQRIWRLVLNDMGLGDKAIRLSNRSLYIDVYPDDHFKTLGAVLRAARPYLGVSFGFYADIMATILYTEYFHVVLSPFIGGGYFNPLVRHWMPRYGHLMRHIILEVDLSRLGFAAQTENLTVSSGTIGMDVLVDTFVQTQLKRRDIGNINKFFLLCRRYYGNRPVLPGSAKNKVDKDTRIPYCPDHALRVVDPIIQLSGLVNSIRICGFNTDYAQFVIRQLFELPSASDGLSHDTPGYAVSKMSPWPRMKGQTSFIDIGNGKLQDIVLDDHNLPAPLGEHEKMPVSYFDEDFDQTENLTFRQRSTSFTTKLIKSFRSDRREKTDDLRNTGTNKEENIALEDPTKKQRTPRVRRSLSLGSVPRPTTPGLELKKTTSRTSLRKQVSNFSLRSKPSKKSLDSSTAEDSETLIPDIPPIPQHYRDAGYARPNLTESTTKYGPTIKGTKIEIQALLERPKTPKAQTSPKKPTETPSRLRLFRKTPKKDVQAETVAPVSKTPSRQTTSALHKGVPSAIPTRSARPKVGTEGTPIASTQTSSKVAARTGNEATAKTVMRPGPKYSIFTAPAPGPSRSTRFVTAQDLANQFQTGSTGSMPQASGTTARNNQEIPRPSTQRSNVGGMSTIVSGRNELSIPRTGLQPQVTPPAHGELVVSRTRPRQTTRTGQSYIFPPNALRDRPMIQTPTRSNNMAPTSSSAASRPRHMHAAQGVGQPVTYPRNRVLSSRSTQTEFSDLRPAPLRTTRSRAGLNTEWKSSLSSTSQSPSSAPRRPPVASNIPMRSRVPVRPRTPVPETRQPMSQPRGQQAPRENFDPDRTQYDITLNPIPLPHQSSRIQGIDGARRFGYIPQPDSEPPLSRHGQYQEHSNMGEQGTGQTVTEDEDSEFF